MRPPRSSCHGWEDQLGLRRAGALFGLARLAQAAIQYRGNRAFRADAGRAGRAGRAGSRWRAEPKSGSSCDRMSSPPSHCAWRVGLLLALTGIGTIACGATGLDWVAEPETAPRASDHEYLAASRAPEPGPATATVEEEPAPEAHPRLSRVVTLGEIEVAPVAQG